LRVIGLEVRRGVIFTGTIVCDSSRGVEEIGRVTSWVAAAKRFWGWNKMFWSSDPASPNSDGSSFFLLSRLPYFGDEEEAKLGNYLGVGATRFSSTVLKLPVDLIRTLLFSVL